MRALAFFRTLSILLAIVTVGCERQGEKQNRLATSTSPYLREHADNPVDWYEWGEEALAKSRAEDKPILLSIGYASCHWCHVMEEESFMDDSVASIMNRDFVCIKVDREQRPDVDQIYLEAAQLISGNSGWPLNAFALPDGRPFFAATYFPKKEWISLMKEIRNLYDTRRKDVEKQANDLTNEVRSGDLLVLGDTAKAFVANHTATAEQLLKAIDEQYGGLKGDQKFPLPTVWNYLLQHHFLTGDERAGGAVRTTLDAMMAGGIWDHLAGGFARYTTDKYWRVPHFEKMLYDNAQLASLYADAYRHSKDTVYLNVLRDIMAFTSREMTEQSTGRFFSSINADSEGEEGKFYVWRPEQIDEILDEGSAKIFKKFYHVTDSGNWDYSKNILYASADNIRELHKNEAQQKVIGESRRKLLEARDRRVRPSTDDKTITSWNAMMISAYVDAYAATSDQRYLQAALKNARFLNENMRHGQELWRCFSRGQASINGFLDDYSFLAKAYIDLYSVTFDSEWLRIATALVETVQENFGDLHTDLFFFAPANGDELVARKMELADQVIPSSNSVMAEVLFLLGHYLQNESYLSKARRMVERVMSGDLPSGGPFYSNWARIADLMRISPFEVAVMGPNAGEINQFLQRMYLPNAFFMGGIKEDLPLLENKLVSGKTIIYVCRERVCKLPVVEAEAALQQLIPSNRANFQDF